MTAGEMKHTAVNFDTKSSDGQLMVVEARRRGVSLQYLADALGVTVQAVSDRVRRYEKRTGEKAVVPQALYTRIARTAWTCPECKKTELVTPKEAAERTYCSHKCGLLAQQPQTRRTGAIAGGLHE